MPSESFDDFVEKLQQEIIEKEIKDFNKYLVQLYRDPPNWGKPSEKDITISHICQGPRGDFMQFFLKIENDIITKANFITDGCGATVAAGSQTTLLIKGKSLKFAETIKFEDINDALGGLPDDDKHGAELAIQSLKELIEKYKSDKG